MYEIKFSKNFRKSFKRILSSSHFRREEFDNILYLLEQGKELPERYHDHVLKGNFSNLRECHISGDCLLLYEIDNTNQLARLINIGNHANLFE